MKFPTHAVLTVSTGRLLGDVAGLYSLLKFLIGRPAYTHDLAYYGRAATKALQHAMPMLPTAESAKDVTEQNWREYLTRWETVFGREIDLPDSLSECLADDKTPIETAEELAPGRVIVIDPDHSG